MTWAHTMVNASHWVGLTFPGMMELPGSFGGRLSSPRPHRGPDPRSRTSLAILFSPAASVLNAPDTSIKESWAASASNKFGAEVNGRPVWFAIFCAMAAAYPSVVFRPVPTAVPPKARRCNEIIEASIRSIPYLTCWAYPENSCPSVSGVASWLCVLPILTILSNSLLLDSITSSNTLKPGTVRFNMVTTDAICIAVGKESFELCPMLQ
mmetsp:Transcript_22140/g.47589  ORF Transcript_22140/g.47589 Transcript_22140/m.47589 type:complete len:209 (-) Transcript_22140:546-1172(-)